MREPKKLTPGSKKAPINAKHSPFAFTIRKTG